jgi:hypothetical protein
LNSWHHDTMLPWHHGIHQATMVQIIPWHQAN